MNSVAEDKRPKHAEDVDLRWIKAFQSGNKNAFDQLVLRYKDRVFSLCYRFLGDYQEANDMAQEIFIKVYKTLDHFRAESSFFTWLYRISVNTCKNRLKSLEFRYRKKRISWPDIKSEDNPGPGQGVEIQDGNPSPLTTMEKREKMQRIQEAINALPKEQKVIVILRDMEGLSYEEIIKLTGHKLGTVKSKLARARILLREKLRGVMQA